MNVPNTQTTDLDVLFAERFDGHDAAPVRGYLGERPSWAAVHRVAS